MVSNQAESVLNFDIDPSFPIIYSRTVGVALNSRVLHSHDLYEISYILRGNGEYRVNEQVFPFSAGDIIMINSGDIHLAYNDQDILVDVFLFDPKQLFSSIDSISFFNRLKAFYVFGHGIPSLIDRSDPCYPRLLRILDELACEMAERGKDYQKTCIYLYHVLSIILGRYVDAHTCEQEYEKQLYMRMLYAPQLDAACQYIRRHYNENLYLQDIAAVANMSVSNFGMIFRKIIGISPMQFLIRERIAQASRLLVESTETVLAISMLCGFSSISSFNEMFKRQMGMTPSEFRRVK